MLVHHVDVHVRALDGPHVPGSMRIAFAAENVEHVDRLAELISKNGASAIEGPQYWTEYAPDYYAVFFEDDNANKYEICYWSAS
jgi:predicted lactoylglutathione lyase